MLRLLLKAPASSRMFRTYCTWTLLLWYRGTENACSFSSAAGAKVLYYLLSLKVEAAPLSRDDIQGTWVSSDLVMQSITCWLLSPLINIRLTHRVSTSPVLRTPLRLLDTYCTSQRYSITLSNMTETNLTLRNGILIVRWFVTESPDSDMIYRCNMSISY